MRSVDTKGLPIGGLKYCRAKYKKYAKSKNRGKSEKKKLSETLWSRIFRSLRWGLREDPRSEETSRKRSGKTGLPTTL